MAGVPNLRELEPVQGLAAGRRGSTTCGLRGCRWGSLYRDQRNGRIEPSDVVGIGRDDAVTACPCAQHDGRIDDIGRPPDSTKLPGVACPSVVERNDLCLFCAEKSGEPGLPPPVAPHLADHTRRHRQSVAVLKVPNEERDDSAVVPLECDERAGIECESRQRGLPRLGRCPPMRPARCRLYAERAIGGTTLLCGQRPASFRKHLVEECRQLVQFDLLCQRRRHVGTDAGGAPLTDRPPSALGQAIGQTHRDLLRPVHTISMTRTGRFVQRYDFTKHELLGGVQRTCADGVQWMRLASPTGFEPVFQP